MYMFQLASKLAPFMAAEAMSPGAMNET